jgi:cytochrome P450
MHCGIQLGEEEEGDAHPPMNTATLAAEASLAIVAGSDTTSVALSNIIFYLIQYPQYFRRLRAELDAAAGEDAAYDVDVNPDWLASLKFLQAVINETIRLQPALPNGAPRTPPKEGGPVAVAGQ